MKQLELFKKLLPGFIPLFIFIIADEIWGMKVGLMVAVATGMVELALTWIREKKPDGFVFLDTALLVAFSGLSVLLDNDLFFKLKPAFLELILAAVIGLSAFSSFNIIGSMTRKYMKGIEMNDIQQRFFIKSLRNLFYITLAHIALIVYSAFYMSSEAWAFISGGMYYILFAIYFGFEFIKNKLRGRRQGLQSFENVNMKDYTLNTEHFTLNTEHGKLNIEEWLPVVEEDGKVIGKAPRTICHRGNKILHPVVHLHVLNPNGYFYLQKRPSDKLVQPNKWDTSVGGHVSFGETLENALKREAYEEIGLKEFTSRIIGKYRWDTELESELVYCFISYDYQKIRLHSEEVKEGKFWSPAQIEKGLGKGIFSPNFEYEYNLLKKSRLMC